MTSSNTDAAVISGRSNRRMRVSSVIGLIIALRPRISSRLTRLVPTMLPTARLRCSTSGVDADGQLGMLVLSDTIVTPMTIGDPEPQSQACPAPDEELGSTEQAGEPADDQQGVRYSAPAAGPTQNG